MICGPHGRDRVLMKMRSSATRRSRTPMPVATAGQAQLHLLSSAALPPPERVWRGRADIAGEITHARKRRLAPMPAKFLEYDSE